MKLKDHLKEVIGWNLEVLEPGLKIFKKQEYLETLKLERMLIPLKKKQLTLKCLKICLKK